MPRLRPRLVAAVAGLLLAPILLLAPQPAPAAEPQGAPTAPARGSRGMVVSTQRDAARAGQAMLARGGNAIDAAVATAFAVGVTQPFSAGLGGGAFVLVRLADGQVLALDARETAPAAADRDMFVRPGVAKRASLVGPLAVATPGFVRGLALLQAAHGTLPLADVLVPAISLAENGFEIGPYHAAILGYFARSGLADRFPLTAQTQLPPGGAPPEPGWRLVQKDLANTLRRIAREGPEVFHEGAIAEAIASHMKEIGGLVTREDLAGYTPVWREPVRGSYRGLEVFSFPPPSSGGIALVETLNILEGFDLADEGAGSPRAVHQIAEAMKLAFADRAAYLGDPDFVDVPTRRLVSKRYAAGLRARFAPPWWSRPPWEWGRDLPAIRVEGPGLPARDSGTTHLSTSDAAGNLVALTMTINTPFGSGITVPGTGIVLNNEMDDFAVAPDTPNAYGLVDTTGANAIAPGKRPLSSMTPTVVLKDGRPFMVAGSPGGPRIISTTLLTILNVVDFGMDAQQAVAAARFHHQWQPDTLFVEPGTDPALVEALRARGHTVEVGERPWSASEAIVIDPASGVHTGGSDPRTDGAAVGWDGAAPGRVDGLRAIQ